MRKNSLKFWEGDFFWQPLVLSIVLLIILHIIITAYQFSKNHPDDISDQPKEMIDNTKIPN